MTIKEQILLERIIDSEYQDGGNDPVDHEVWLDYIVNSKSRGGTLTSLVKKGFVKIEIIPMSKSGNRANGISDSRISITRAGMSAYGSAAALRLRSVRLGRSSIGTQPRNRAKMMIIP